LSICLLLHPCMSTSWDHRDKEAARDEGKTSCTESLELPSKTRCDSLLLLHYARIAIPASSHTQRATDGRTTLWPFCSACACNSSASFSDKLEGDGGKLIIKKKVKTKTFFFVPSLEPRHSYLAFASSIHNKQ
jgi:hypothetical protein